MGAKAVQPPAPLLPLAPSGTRIKRKPSGLLASRFQPKERKKFHPKSKVQVKEEDKEEINEISVEPKTRACPCEEEVSSFEGTEETEQQVCCFQQETETWPSE